MTLRLSSTLKWGLGLLVAVCLLLLAAILFASFWINQDAGKREIDAALARATGGTATYERIDLRLLPLPGAIVRQPRISIPGTLELQADELTVRFAALPLLTGRVRVRTAHVSSPQAVLQLPAPRADDKPFDVAGTERQIRAVLERIVQAAPSAVLTSNAARIDIRIGDRPPLTLSELDVQLDSDGGGLDVELSCASTLWEQLNLTASLAAADLAGEGRAQVSGFRTHDLGLALGMLAQWPVDEASVEFTAQWKMQGLTRLQAQATASAPTLELNFGEARVPLQGVALQGSVVMGSGTTRWVVEHAKVDAPQLAAAGALTIGADAVDLAITMQDADLAILHALRKQLEPAVPRVVRLPFTVEAGSATALALRSRAQALDDLFDLSGIEFAAVVDSARLVFPDPGLTLDGVHARVALALGELRLEEVRARVGKSSAQDGHVTLGLAVTPMTLHAEALLSLDLAETLALAKRLVSNPTARSELARIQELQGTARAHLALGGAFGRLEPRIAVSAIQASGRHAAVPLPVRLSSGRLGYSGGELTADGVDGALGKSSFTGVTGSLKFSRASTIEVQRAHAALAIDELFGWLKSRKDLAGALKPLRNLSGAASLSVTSLHGDLAKPQDWRFAASARPQRLLIDVPEFAPPVLLDGGQVLLTQQDVQLQAVKTSALDAALTLTGAMQDYRSGVASINAKADGVLGIEALRWIEQRADIPREIHLEPPLSVHGVGFDWKRGGAVAAKGDIRFANGPAIGFDVRHDGKQTDVQTLTVRDAVSNATFSGSFSEDAAQARFVGKIAASTVQRIFIHHDLDQAEVEGDLRAQGDLRRALQASVVGHLRGSGIPIPAELPAPLMLQSFSVRTDQNVLDVDSATLRSGENRVEVDGRITRTPDGYVIDIDVQGDTLTIPDELLEFSRKRGKSKSLITNKKLLARLAATRLSGRVGVNFKRILFLGFDIAPLVAVGRHQNQRADLHITNAALCGISMKGTATLLPASASFQTTLSARNQPIGESVLCLTERRVAMTGDFDLDATLSAEGKIRGIVDALRGSFSFTARNGSILQFDALNRIFGLLNVTSMATGQLPDLRAAGMPYTSASARGTLQGTRVAVDELALNARNVTVAARFTLDFVTDQVSGTVLVAPLPSVNWLVSKLPILGRIFGTTVLAIPVQISGSADSPVVFPLGPAAVATRLGDILSNTVRLPFDLIRAPFGASPSAPAPAPAGTSP